MRGLNDRPFQTSKDILDWKFYQADIRTEDLKQWKDTNVVFVYQRGQFYQTSLALDDIRLRPGECRAIPFAPPKVGLNYEI